MAHPKLDEAIETAKSAQARAERAAALAGQIDDLRIGLGRLKRYSVVRSVELTNGESYAVRGDVTRTAMGRMLIDAYEAELVLARNKLDSL